MKLTREEYAARKASFRKMSAADKADYLWTYYKLPILLTLLALALIYSAVYRQFTRKEIFLHSAHINISVGDDLEERLSEGFISSMGADPKRAEVDLYRGLYLSDNASDENHQYGYASRMKILATIESKELDVVLMNREAYDILSHKGYLLALPDLLSGDASLYRFLEPHLTMNTVILEDNAIEYNLKEADEYAAITEDVLNGIDISAFPLFSEVEFSDVIYLGVIANSPRRPAVLQYITYLAAAPAGASD